MNTTVWIVIVCLLVGVIIGLTISDRVSTGMVVKPEEGLKPVKVFAVEELNPYGINKIVIEEDNVVCYIKTNQGQGMTCFKETTTK